MDFTSSNLSFNNVSVLACFRSLYHFLQALFDKNIVPAFSGVKPEKLEEGLSPRHCALSLVGEPIMYPEINALVDELHHRHISTFLVTNAQFPEKIKALRPITQVIFSIDCTKFHIFVFECSMQQLLKNADSINMFAAVCQCGRSYKRELEGC